MITILLQQCSSNNQIKDQLLIKIKFISKKLVLIDFTTKLLICLYNYNFPKKKSKQYYHLIKKLIITTKQISFLFTN